MNLFWKLFAAFGIAMALTLVGAVFVGFRLASLAFDQMNIENREEIIAQAARVLNNQGEPGLQGWLRARPRPVPGIMLMVLNERNEDLLGRELPGRFERLLRRPPSRNPERLSNFRPPQLTTNVVGPNGQEYRFLFVRTRMTVLGVLTWPATQLAVLTLAVLAAAATSLVLARYLSSPIVRLQRASRALAAGALETRVGAPFNRRKDEVGTLARDFDTMAERIQALVTDKETLLRDVSHELRSPLARIGVALALAQRKANDASQADLLRIEQEAARLDELVGQVMDLARLRTQAAKRFEPVELDELVAEVVDNARFEHPDARIDYTPIKLPPVPGEALELRSAFENVLRNALAYSEGAGAVSVGLKSTGTHIEIAVGDRGPGVPNEDLERIFEPFYRADKSRDHRHDGQGIGLAITSRVVERHGGRARARNRPGGGLEVTLALPLQAANASD
jgi:two-component system sensor histidine kinase CpxA